MGLGGVGIWQLLIVLLIVLLLFGTKRLKNVGSDLGNAIKGFKGAMNDADKEAQKNASAEKLEQDETGETIEGKITSRDKDNV